MSRFASPRADLLVAVVLAAGAGILVRQRGAAAGLNPVEVALLVGAATFFLKPVLTHA